MKKRIYSVHAIQGSASMALTLFAEDCIQEREDDADHGAKAERRCVVNAAGGLVTIPCDAITTI